MEASAAGPAVNKITRFAYAQARLQARHGQRPDEQLWRRLRSTGDLANYLQMARQTVLRPWVMGIDSGGSSDDIEFALRRQFRLYIDEVARWLPADWRSAFQALQTLLDLPALQYLLSGEGLPAWMPEDPVLRGFASQNVKLRGEAIQASEAGYLVQAWQRGEPLHDAWYDAWRRRWPGPARLNAAMERLGRLMLQHIRSVSADSGPSTAEQRQVLLSKLTTAFRKYSFQPAAAFCHLGLVALDLEMLRGDLLRRKLFSESVGTA
jgi:hypothetical protein